MVFGISLIFRGNCAECAAFYSDVFGVTPSACYTFGDKRGMFGELPAAKEKYIFQAVLDIPGSPGLRLLMGDTPALLFTDEADIKFGIATTQHVSIEISEVDAEIVRSMYGKLMSRGKANKELHELPGGLLSGSLIDIYGICWNINTVNAE